LVVAIQVREALLTDLRRQMKAAECSLAAETLAGRLPLLTVAESRLSDIAVQRQRIGRDYEDREDDLARQGVQATADVTQARAITTGRLADALEDIAHQQAARAQVLGILDVERLAVQAIILETRDAAAAKTSEQAALATAQETQAQAAAELIRIEMEQAHLAAARAAWQARAAELSAVTTRLLAVDDRWLAWRTLAQALGRDGLPKLEIDAAGPTVSQITNDLLTVGFGTRFMLDVTTQVARADGKGLKEEFTIRVLDNAYGGESRDIGDLSGGERVVVEEALRAGILLFNNSRRSRPILTCWRDETTGALDPENVPRYVAMLRRMHQLGEFRHTLFVTHSEAAASLADTVIRVQAGMPTIERVA